MVIIVVKDIELFEQIRRLESKQVIVTFSSQAKESIEIYEIPERNYIEYDFVSVT